MLATTEWSLNLLEYLNAGDVHCLQINHGKVNGMDLKLCLGICEHIAAFEKSAGKCLILQATNSKKVFSAGIDLKLLMNSDIEYTKNFFPALIDLFESTFYCSKPIVAVVEGAAIAGGCVLASACAARIATDDARFGMPTPKLKVPIPQIAHTILRSAAPEELAELLHGGIVYSASQALKIGLVKKIVQPDLAVATATEVGKSLIDEFQANLRDPEQRARFKVEDDQMIAQWCTKELRDRVRRYIDSEL